MSLPPSNGTLEAATTAGRVRGHHGPVRRWLGIPFAAPARGELPQS